VAPDSTIDAHPLGAEILRDLPIAQAEVVRAAQRLVTAANTPAATRRES
jgi:hypothetical protein